MTEPGICLAFVFLVSSQTILFTLCPKCKVLMKRLVIVSLLLLNLNSCKFLGIGKQCYTCTTQVSLTAGGVPKSSYDKEVCGSDERTKYIEDNKGLKNGAYLFTSCVNK